MRLWLRRRGMAWLVHPLRVQRVKLHRERKRLVRMGRVSAERPCWRCGYELLGQPDLLCVDCGATHDPGWYRGWFGAGRYWRQFAGGLVMYFYPWASLMGVLTILVGYSLWAASRLPPVTPTFQNQDLAGVLIAGLGVLTWPVAWCLGWTNRRAVVWGPPRVATMRVAVVMAACLLPVAGFSLIAID